MNNNEFNEVSRKLLSSIPKAIANKLKIGFHEKLPLDEETIDYFSSSSTISEILIANPGSHEMLELIYTGQGIKGNIDEYFFNCLAGQALRNRLNEIIEHIISMLPDHKENINILNLGCGTARDTIETVKQLNGNIHAFCVDTSSEALNIAKLLANGIHCQFSFIEKSMTEYIPNDNIQIVLLIGIFCSLDARVCRIILKKILKNLNPGAIVIASNVHKNMLRDDPFTAYLLKEIIGWNLIYKTEENLKDIFEKSGLSWKGGFFEKETNFHYMGIGEVI